MKTFHALPGLFFSLILLFAGEAAAQSCTALVQQQFNALKVDSSRVISVTGILVAPSASADPVLAHMDGFLSVYTAEFWILDGGIMRRVPGRLSSGSRIGDQYFNDRRYETNEYAPGQYGATVLQEYSVHAKDKVLFELDDTGKFTVTLASWGNVKHVISSPTCNGNLMTGFAGSRLYAFTFR
jgi:hypothetical protein